MQLSLIIPTYNRAEILKECLLKLEKQDFVKNEFEIIVVDDGSKDETKKIVEEFAANSKIATKYLFQKNQGQGIARNYGLRYAKGKIIMFIGDDMLPVNDCISQHLKFHRKFMSENEAVLGFVGWDPRLEVTPFMEWLTDGSSIMGKFGGHQFAYEKLDGKQTADYNFFYTANISMKRSLLKKHRFDSKFSSYGWEDIELGYRLFKREGLVLHYNPKSIVYHYHEIDEKSMAHRMKMIGASAKLIHKKYPELGKVPAAWKKFLLKLISSPVSLYLFKLLKDLSKNKYCTLYYYSLSKKYFLEGLESEM